MRSVTSLTRSGNTATVTTSVAARLDHRRGDHDRGRDPAAYNGSVRDHRHGRDRPSPTRSPGTPATPATGTITATGPTVRAFPSQVLTFHVRVRNTGTGSATNVRIDDAIPANTTYVAGSMAYSLNASAFTSR